MSDAVRVLLVLFTSKPKDVVNDDLHNSEDVRRVIEKVEVIDSVDIDAIHSQLNDIAEEKAAARRALGTDEKKEIRKTPEAKVEKPQRIFPGFEDLKTSSEKSTRTSKEQPVAKSSAENIMIVDSKGSNPYIKEDNVTAFID